MKNVILNILKNKSKDSDNDMDLIALNSIDSCK